MSQGTRKDNLMTCPECGRKLRPCNYERHIEARHPDSAALLALRHVRILEMVRGLF